MSNVELLKSISNNFSAALSAAKSGKKNSLSYTKHLVSFESKIKNDEVFQVLRFGGSTYQNALVKQTNNTIKILSIEQGSLPLMSSKQVFLSFIESALNTEVEHVAINFAYVMEPIDRAGYLDGRLLTSTKEHDFDGLIGSLVGETIEKYIFERCHRSIHVALANDAVCLLLSGLTQFKGLGLGGGIVGTGLNMAFFDDTQSIIVTESWNFDNFPQSNEGRAIDASSKQPGEGLIQKEIAGKYLFQHYNMRLAASGSNHPTIKSTEELDAVARGKAYGESQLARRVLEHSAQLVACQIAGIAQFNDTDMTFIMEGSLFWKGYTYKSAVEETVTLIAPKYKVSFEEILNSGIIGAAKLVC